jgi:hypothetical protein
MGKGTAFVGAADHCGWAILVTVARDGTLIDRRRVDLVEDGLPKLPHHHDCQGLPVDEAVALVARVRRSADACARACLESLARSVPATIAGISIRACPPLPATVAERVSNYRAQARLIVQSGRSRSRSGRRSSSAGLSVRARRGSRRRAGSSGARGRCSEHLDHRG